MENYNRIQVFFYNKITAIVDNILSDSSNIQNRDNIIKVFTKFIISNVKYFAEPDTISLFESYLLELNQNGKMFIMSTSKPIVENISYIEMNDYINEKFIPLSKILNKYISFQDDTYCQYATYGLMLKLSIQIFGLHYVNTFGEINRIEIENIDQIIYEYFIRSNELGFDPIAFSSIFTFYLLQKGLYKNQNYLLLLPEIVEKVKILNNEYKIDMYEKQLLENIESEKETIHTIDLMTGIEFEIFISRAFINLGYSVELTSKTNDQGIDIIAKKNQIAIGIQTKCYGGTVGNHAIQEVVAGLKYYNLSQAMVITNSYFTEAAKTLAAANDVILWDRCVLIDKLNMGLT